MNGVEDATPFIGSQDVIRMKLPIFLPRYNTLAGKICNSVVVARAGRNIRKTDWSLTGKGVDHQQKRCKSGDNI